MVPNVPWHRAPAVRGPAPPKKISYLIVIFIGNQITDIYATLPYVHGPWVIGYITIRV